MSHVSVAGLCKRFQQTIALDNVSIDFQDGEFFGLLGPSGSGKTTLLRCIAGFIQPDSGVLSFNDRPVASIPVHKRAIGMVFQNYALFPHLTVFDNIAFGLSVRGVARKTQREKVTAMLKLVRLDGFEKRKPRQLSGGQQQRVALARALMTEPTVLLLDEPLGALDKRLRQEMQIELKQIQRELGLTTIFVTHDQEEALTLSDRIAIIDQGKLVQMGAPAEVYERPNSRFAADFLGDANFFTGDVVAMNQIQTAYGAIATSATLPTLGTQVTVAVRPEKILLNPASETSSTDLDNQLSGRITQTVYSGSSTTYIVSINGGVLTVFEQNRRERALASGTEVIATWTSQHSVVVSA